MTRPNPTASQPEEMFPAQPSEPERRRLADLLRAESVGGILLVVMAIAGLVIANSPLSGWYFALSSTVIGPAEWHLDLTVAEWVADGLLAVFFFLIGLELKREIVAGDLRHLRRALAPVTAAVGGVVVPVLIFLAIAGSDPLARDGWAVPVATDIAFALAVLAVLGSHLPSALRLFLLTLAVVDDLIGIMLIAVISAKDVDWVSLGIAVGLIAVYGVVAHRWRTAFTRSPVLAWFILLPLGVLAWVFVHHGGIHATIAGVALGMTVPVLAKRSSRSSTNPSESSDPGLAESLEHHLRPLSAGIIVPLFAFFSAGVVLGAAEGQRLISTPLFWGIVFGLVLGKPLGIVGLTWLLSRFRVVSLDPSYRWIDLWGVGALAGIGFTVSLLIANITFDPGSLEQRAATFAILCASAIAALLAASILVGRNRHYRSL